MLRLDIPSYVNINVHEPLRNLTLMRSTGNNKHFLNTYTLMF